MKQSGAGLVEVGTTNRTRLSDYETAVTETTKAILKVHTSNYRIIGFTEETSIEQLAPLREKYGIPLVEDLGSGALLDLTKYGLPGEPNVQDALRRGADIVCFSGDKLLGGPQAGIIAGKKEYIEKMRSNPLFRALRIDKITAAFLETILLEYRSMERALVRIPTLRMLTQNEKEIAEDAAELKILLEQAAFDAEIALYPCRSKVGGGALPVTELSSMAVGIRPSKISAETLSRRLRRLPIPVVTRIEDENVLVDARTFEMEYASEFVRMLKEAEYFPGKCVRRRSDETDHHRDGRAYRPRKNGADPRADRTGDGSAGRRTAQRDHDRSGIYLDGSGKWDARRGHRCPRT